MREAGSGKREAGGGGVPASGFRLPAHIFRIAILLPSLLLAQQSHALQGDSARHHDVRNGAIIGAAIGIAAGVYGGSKIGTGCLIAAGACDAGHKQRTFMVAFGAEGGLAGGLAGALGGAIVAIFRAPSGTSPGASYQQSGMTASAPDAHAALFPLPSSLFPFKDSTPPTHYVRNGAIIGAIGGVVWGVVQARGIHYGCFTSATNRCNSRGERLSAEFGWGAVGGVLGAPLGALAGWLVDMGSR